MIIGLGVDVVDVARVARLLERAGRERVFARLLSPVEREYCASLSNPVPSVAARIAAKEAAYKALSGTEDARGIGWRDVEVVHDPFRRPTLVLHGAALDRWRALGCTQAHVSLSHSALSAVATVILEG